MVHRFDPGGAGDADGPCDRDGTCPAQTISGEAQINGAPGTLRASPQVLDDGVVSAATFTVMALAPGAIFSIFGSLLSDGTLSAPVLPLSYELDNTIVRLEDPASRPSPWM